jgi:hypothetical protein
VLTAQAVTFVIHYSSWPHHRQCSGPNQDPLLLQQRNLPFEGLFLLPRYAAVSSIAGSAGLILGALATFRCVGYHTNWFGVPFLRMPHLPHKLYLPATNYFTGSKPQDAPAPLNSGDAPAVDSRTLPPANVKLGWELNTRLDMHVYLTTSPNEDVFSNQWTSGWMQNHDRDLPHFVWENLTFGNWKDSRTVQMDVKFPEVSIFYVEV